MNVKNTYLHYANDKGSNEWYRKVANLVYSNGGCVNLLADKKIDEIYQYSTGNIDMSNFKSDFKSEAKKLKKAQGNSQINNIDSPSNIFLPLPLIPVKRNSAAHLVHKTKQIISCIATDVYALEKKKKDIDFLKNRPEIQAIKQDLADKLGQGEVDAGSTRFSSIPYKEAPFGLDLNDSAELDIFKKVFYKLQPEAAYEYALRKINALKKFDGIELLNIYDTIDYGVACSEVTMSNTTGLPNLNYIHPSEINVPRSKYMDFRDCPYGWRIHHMTPIELQDNFGHEFDGIPLDKIINGENNNTKGSYIGSNGLHRIPNSNFNTNTISVVEIQFKSIDGLHIFEDANGNKRFVKKEQSSYSIFVQNTYKFYWVLNTNYFFGKEKFGFAYREFGQEAFVSLGWIIYKSQEKSAIEQCVSENKAAQMAYIKLLYAIVKSLPNGKFVDIKYLENAIPNYNIQDKTPAEALQELVDKIFEENIFIGSSAGFDGTQDGNYPPYKEMPGGLRDEVNGYIQIIRQAQSNISKFTGINEEMTGTENNPNLLNGARQSNIKYGMNAINYAYLAKNKISEAVFNVTAYCIKEAIEKGGRDRDVFEDFIGIDRTCTIDDFGGIKDHKFYLEISLGMNDQEEMEFNQNVNKMLYERVISNLEKYIIDNTPNLKDAKLMLAMIEHKKAKEAQASQQAAYEQAQQLKGMEMQTLAATEQMKASSRKEEISLQGEVKARILQLASQLGINEIQVENMLKSNMQERRLINGLIKTEKQLQAKKEMNFEDKLEPFV